MKTCRSNLTVPRCLRLVVGLLATLGAAASATQSKSVPVDGVTGILAAFETHQLVALGEGNHGNEQGHAFRLALIRDPRFAAAVNDIVVEFGSARYQDLMDRYLAGEAVPERDLRQVWQNTTQAHTVWDAPIYREFFQAVREVNRGRPPDRRLRVLLGDPPIDWSDISTPEQLRARLMAPDADRDGHAASLIRREVLAKHRRALLVYGELHLTRKSPFGTAVPKWVSIVERLERDDRARIFSIWTYTIGGDITTLAPDVGSWTPPRLAILGSTVLGQAEFRFYYPFEVRGPDGVIKAAPGPMAEQFDALLYLGPTGSLTYSRLGATECADSEYLTMRARRMALAGDDAGLEAVRARLERSCAARPN